jgi:hypothetical protein
MPMLLQGGDGKYDGGVLGQGRYGRPGEFDEVHAMAGLCRSIVGGQKLTGCISISDLGFMIYEGLVVRDSPAVLSRQIPEAHANFPAHESIIVWPSPVPPHWAGTGSHFVRAAPGLSLERREH